MITHKSNFDALLLADSCTFPRLNIQVNTYHTDDGIRYKLSLFTKVTVKGRNGERYFVPVADKFSAIKQDELAIIISRFQDTCRIVQDHYITTEGRDVLVEDYNKVMDFKQ